MLNKSEEVNSGIKVRKKNYNFDGVRRFWFADKPFHTHFLNMMNVLFPTGEDFFIKSVQKYRTRVQEPVLSQQMKDFSAQEMQHSLQHAYFLDNLREMGYKYDGLVRLAEITSGWIRTDPLRLAATAAFEHFTAIFSRIALSNLLPNSSPIDPKMKELYEWHTAEELEHKCVAIDVLNTVHNSYLLRAAGMFVAANLFFPVIFSGVAYFLYQDGALFRVSTVRDFFSFTFGKTRFFWEILGEVFNYLRPGFHPSQSKDLYLAQEVFERHEAASV